jgi:amidohydrolase
MASHSEIVKKIRPNLGPYEELYKDFHRHPELSKQEERTAKIVADRLGGLEGIEVHRGIGGHGVVGILRNGSGKTVWLRADMDALPVLEDTGLEYSSRVRMRDVDDGVEKPVMHACGHDMHTACLLAAAEALTRARDAWHGTVVFVFQPNEEHGAGAQAMVDAGLYDVAPRPDAVLGQHLMPYRTGMVGSRRGFMASAADNFDITVYGRGGHASQPHLTIDPVVLAAHIAVRLQGIVSREAPPGEQTVLTIGSIQAGQTANIIPDRATLIVNIRTTTVATRTKVLAALKRIVRAECAASDSPQEPDFKHNASLPLTINDDAVTARVEEPFRAHFGERYLSASPPLGGSEDFANLATAHGIPYCYWIFGGTDPQKWDEAEKNGTLARDIPINHSPFFAPVLQPTMTIGVDALILAALAFLT